MKDKEQRKVFIRNRNKAGNRRKCFRKSSNYFNEEYDVAYEKQKNSRNILGMAMYWVMKKMIPKLKNSVEDLESRQ